MENIEIYLYILLGIFSIAGFFLLRNNWVYKKSNECIDNGTHNLLPDYDAMMYRFWVWDIEKFKKK